MSSSWPLGDNQPRAYMARQADIALTTADILQYAVGYGGYGFDLGPSDGIGLQAKSILD
jgi:hypothetical protein